MRNPNHVNNFKKEEEKSIIDEVIEKPVEEIIEKPVKKVKKSKKKRFF